VLEKLDKLRKRPEATRRKTTLVVSLALTLAIFIIWLSFYGRQISLDTEVIKENTDKLVSPLGNLLEDAENVIKEIKKSF